MSQNQYVTPDLEVRVYSVSFAYTIKQALNGRGDHTTASYPRLNLPVAGNERDQVLIDRFFGFVQRMAKEGGLGIVIESDDSYAEVIRFYKHGENTTRDILLSSPDDCLMPKWLTAILDGVRPGKPGNVVWLPTSKASKEEAIRGRELENTDISCVAVSVPNGWKVQLAETCDEYRGMATFAQLRRPCHDDDLHSEVERDVLVALGYVQRVEGWNWLSPLGVAEAVRRGLLKKRSGLRAVAGDAA